MFYRYCGLLYKAEALVALDRIADAVSHLNPENVTDISTVNPEPKNEQGECSIKHCVYSLFMDERHWPSTIVS